MGYGMGRGMGAFGNLGAECPPGYYKLKVFGVDTGQCLPTGSTVASGVQTGVSSSVATGVAQSPATAQAVQSVAANAIGTRIVNFYKGNPVVAWGATAAVAALLVYGGMSFIRGR